MSVFLSACESIPSNSSKPVFKIANFPSVKQKKENINDSDQKVNQSKTEKETDLVNTNALNKATQPEKITLDVVPQEERKNDYQKNPEEMVDQNAFTSLPDSKETNIQDNQLLDTNDLAFTKDKPILTYYYTPTSLMGKPEIDLVRLTEPSYKKECWDSMMAVVDKIKIYGFNAYEPSCANEYKDMALTKLATSKFVNANPDVQTFVKSAFSGFTNSPSA